MSSLKPILPPQQQHPQQFIDCGHVVHAAGSASVRRPSGRQQSKSAGDDGDGDPPAAGFLDRKGLASRWKISISTLKRLEAAGELTPTRLGPRSIRYAVAHILEIEEAKQA